MKDREKTYYNQTNQNVKLTYLMVLERFFSIIILLLNFTTILRFLQAYKDTKKNDYTWSLRSFYEAYYKAKFQPQQGNLKWLTLKSGFLDVTIIIKRDSQEREIEKLLVKMPKSTAIKD